MRMKPRAEQEADISRVLAEPTRAALVGSQPGNGKTLLGVEIALRSGAERVLFIGVRDTFAQWASVIDGQSEGHVSLRRIDGTEPGKQAFADMMSGQPGFFFSGSQYLVAQDWESRPERNPDGTKMFKTVKTDNFLSGAHAGDLVLRRRKPRAIGPAEEPIVLTKSHHLNTFRKKLKAPLGMVVFDEIQMVSNRRSNGRRTLGSIKTDWKVALSGTWFGNNPENAWTVANWLWPDADPVTGQCRVETNFRRWREKWITAEVVYGRNGQPLTTPRGTAITKVIGEQTPGAFAASLPCYIRRENDEQAPEAKIIYCDATPEQAAQIEELKRDLLTFVQDWQGSEAPLVVELPTALNMRLRQATIAELSIDENDRVGFADNAASAKLRPLRALVEHYGDQPVGIFTDSKVGAKFIALRMRKAGLVAEAYTGDLSETERTDLKARFMAGEVRYLIGTIQSMGTGIDGLQTACSKVIWVSEVPGNPSANEQALARYFRQGRTIEHGEFEHTKILMRDSVDTETLEHLIEKAWQMTQSMRVAS